MPTDITRRGVLQAAALAGAAAMAGSSAWAQEKVPQTPVALVGGAHIHTPSYINLLNKRADVRVVGVWDHDAARAQARAKALNSKVVKSPTEIWSDRDIKAVVICSETNLHHDLVLAAAKAGKHMFAEKPLGITGKESLEMADAVTKANVLFTTGYFSRTLPKYLFVKQQVEKGAFGKITRVRGSNCHNGSLGRWFDTEWRWMADPKIAGCGGFGDLGTHLLDILMWMIGDVDWVTADIKVVTGNYGDCDESGEALIRFKNGVTGTLGAGWVDVADPVSLLISGTEGHAAVINGEVFIVSKSLKGADGKSPWKELPTEQPAPLNQFLDAVQGKPGQHLVPVREAAARVQVMEAMYQGAKDRKWVRVA
jgi:predicted dehydrogenase